MRGQDPDLPKPEEQAGHRVGGDRVGQRAAESGAHHERVCDARHAPAPERRVPAVRRGERGVGGADGAPPRRPRHLLRQKLLDVLLPLEAAAVDLL